jgi:hypothetical protein
MRSSSGLSCGDSSGANDSLSSPEKNDKKKYPAKEVEYDFSFEGVNNKKDSNKDDPVELDEEDDVVVGATGTNRFVA